MRYDDASLERALAALPLEEPPEDLRARILAAVSGAQQLDAPFRPWELWVIGAVLAIGAWLIASHALDALVADFSPSLVLWTSIGAFAVLAVQLSERARAVLPRARP